MKKRQDKKNKDRSKEGTLSATKYVVFHKKLSDPYFSDLQKKKTSYSFMISYTVYEKNSKIQFENIVHRYSYALILDTIKRNMNFELFKHSSKVARL